MAGFLVVELSLVGVELALRDRIREVGIGRVDREIVANRAIAAQNLIDQLLPVDGVFQGQPEIDIVERRIRQLEMEAVALAKETDKAGVIRHMVGREIGDLFPRRSSQPGDVLLQVKGLTVGDEAADAPRLHDIHLELRAGEVLGIGGLMGAGRTELLMHLFGAWGRRQSGTISLRGRELTRNDPRERIAGGMVLASEDRRRYGLVLEHSIGFNLSLSSLSSITRGLFIRRHQEIVRNQGVFSDLRIKATGLSAIAGRLSGGNQQKVVFGKALLTEPQVILLDEPTRGIDVGAKLEIYEIINRLTSEGKAVLLVSSELPELIGMSDRIVMLREGRIGGEFRREDATQEKLMQAAMAE